MTNKPLVSVIIPTCKRASLVSRAIESARRQTYENLEILVVDDGSPDNTEEVVKGIADSRIRYIRHEQSRGAPAVRNTGIQAAEGMYVAFLDDDDEWREDKLERQLSYIGAYDAVLTGALVNGKYLRLHGKREITLDDLRKGNNFPPSTLVAKTSVMRKVPFDEGLRQGEDWDVYIRLAQRYRIGYVSEPLLLLSDGSHQRVTNEARNKPLTELEKRMAMLIKHKDFFGKYWFRRHTASVILTYIRARSGKLRQLRYAIDRCGVFPVLAVLTAKVSRALRRIGADVKNGLPARKHSHSASVPYDRRSI